MLIAGADAATPVHESLALAGQMREAGADVDAVVRDGAPHSFFDRSFVEHAEACATACEHLLALTDRDGDPDRGRDHPVRDRRRHRLRGDRHRDPPGRGPASQGRLAGDLPDSLRRLMPLIEQRIPAGMGKARRTGEPARAAPSADRRRS